VTLEHHDVLIVGAGLAGIGAACHLQRYAPGQTYAIVEARGASGGTWDLFRFPGVRSDSDMFTLGYGFRPWTSPKSMAGGGEILSYLRETAAAHGVDRHITYHRRVVGAEWSSADAQWTVTVEQAETGERSQRTCGFLYLCCGYYRQAGRRHRQRGHGGHAGPRPRAGGGPRDDAAAVTVVLPVASWN